MACIIYHISILFLFLANKEDMEVQILSKEIIKPSAPTPYHLRTYKLSILDQLAPPTYVPVLLFYSPANENPGQKAYHLKKSFAKALACFYPFAGRLKENSSVDCNDDGATYVEARAAGSMAMVLQKPDINHLEQLLPCKAHETLPKLSTHLVLLAVQVNHFDCGGLAISICMWHGVGDASSLANFIKCWAQISCGAEGIDNVVSDCASIFPPHELLSFSRPKPVKDDWLSKNVMKRFVFDGSKIANLRQTLRNETGLDRPTRIEVVSALIWGAVMASGEQNEAMKLNTASVAVDLRKRINPPLPQQSIGNIFQATMVNWPKNDALDLNGLVGKIHEYIRKMDNDYVRHLHMNGGYLKMLRSVATELEKNPNARVFGFSSWCRLPFFGADFGWGKPIWSASGMRLNNAAIFLDAKDGEAIEAWVGMAEEDMVKFEKNPGIIAYSSFNPSII